MADRPLTTGEGNTALADAIELLEMEVEREKLRSIDKRRAQTLLDALAECGRLRAFSKRANDNCVSLSEQLDAARQALTYIAGYQSETQSDAEGVTLMQAAARAALGVGDG